VRADLQAGEVERPPGVELDSGGLAKGLAADDVAAALDGFPRFSVDCAGDLRVGGADPRSWRIDVASPAGGPPVATLAALNGTAVATSGITRRRWRQGGAARHHLLDPATGQPAFTGVVQATALAPTGLEAEVRAKTALLAGPHAGPGHLVHGGALVLADGEVLTVEPGRQAPVAA
jgi:thiamine biosynthesis lipoprotein